LFLHHDRHKHHDKHDKRGHDHDKHEHDPDIDYMVRVFSGEF